MPRRLTPAEVNELLTSDHVARLATIDEDGYPHVTPLWFVFEDGSFHLTSDSDRPHVARIRANPKVGLVIDTEAAMRPDGERPNRQVRITGEAVLTPDDNGAWTARIWAKYQSGPTNHASVAERLQDRHRTLISIRPSHRTALASV